MIFLLVLLATAAVVLFWGVAIYNKLVKLRNHVEEGASGTTCS
jgi:hypothetical protein